MATPPQVSAQAQRFRTWPASLSASSVNQSVGGAANQAATVSLQGSSTGVIGGAAQNPAVEISSVWWSYSGTPTGGRLTITDGSANNWIDVDITAGGPGFINFVPPVQMLAATNMLVTLAAGGSGVTGKVGVNAWSLL